MHNSKTLSSIINSVPHRLHIPNNGKKTQSSEASITDITCDSRKVTHGALFFALNGTKEKGTRYVPEAISRGAAAVVCDTILPNPVTQVIVADALSAMSAISANFYGHPSQKLNVTGVTGTNGKTTVTYLLESILKSAGISNAVIGTINNRINGNPFSSSNTTPLSCELQAYLREFVDAGVRSAVMEVSSHALALNRVDDVEFDTAIFTNITQDHLDYHITLDNYKAAKARLFRNLCNFKNKPAVKTAVINTDDPWGKQELIALVPAEAKCITYSVKDKSSDFYAENVRLSINGLQFTLRCPDSACEISSSLIGLHNVYNILAATCAAKVQGINLDNIIEGVRLLKDLPGRLERINTGTGFSLIVDYAHTEDALKNALAAIHEIAPGSRTITVFGCGGDRDRTKRPLMGAVVSKLSDYAIITSDNPRTEDPKCIAGDAESGIIQAGRTNYEIILDRKEAIKKALSMAKTNDVVLIAGKGHETYQIVGNNKIPFDDREVARELLKT